MSASIHLHRSAGADSWEILRGLQNISDLNVAVGCTTITKTYQRQNILPIMEKYTLQINKRLEALNLKIIHLDHSYPLIPKNFPACSNVIKRLNSRNFQTTDDVTKWLARSNKPPEKQLRLICPSRWSEPISDGDRKKNLEVHKFVAQLQDIVWNNKTVSYVPLPEVPAYEFMKKNNCIWLWTDGSVKNGRACSSVYSGRDISTINRSRVVTGKLDSMNAELDGILMALEILPSNYNARIFTDSEASISIINNWNTYTDTEKSKSAHRLVIERIICRLDKLCTYRITILFEHVNSHLFDGKNSQKKEKRRQKMREKYGSDCTFILLCNQKVDEQAEEFMNTMMPLPKPQFHSDLPGTIICDADGNPWIRNTRKELRKLFHERKIELWKKRTTRRSADFKNPEIDKHNWKSMSTPDIKHKQYNNLRHRITTRQIYSNDIASNNINSTVDSYCVHCHNSENVTVIETIQHIFRDCPAAKSLWNRAWSKIKRRTAKLLDNQNDTLPIPDEITNISLFLVPAEIVKLYKKRRKNKKSTAVTSIIFSTTNYYSLLTWRERCARNRKHWNLGAHRNNDNQGNLPVPSI